MDEQLRIDLQATDTNASQNIQKVMDAFDRLRDRLEAAGDEFEKVFGREAPTKAMTQAMEQAGRSMASALDRFGASAEATFVRLTNTSQTAFKQMEEAADRAAQREIDDMSKLDAERQRARDREAAAVERQAQTYIAIDKQRTAAIRTQMQSHVEAYLAGERQIVDSAQKTAEQQILANRKAEQQLEDFDQKLAQHVQRQAQAESRSREETFFMVQAANQKIVADDEKRAQAEIQAAERAAQAERKYREDLFFYVQSANQKLEQEEATRLQRQMQLEEQAATRRRAIMSNIAGAGARGIGNIVSNAPGAIGNILGTAGGGIARAAEAGMGALGGVVSRVTGFFGGLADSIAHTTSRVTDFIAVGIGIATVYEAVNLLERVFHTMGGAITEFQDKMVQVQSLRMGENLKGEFEDVRAAVLETSMETGRTATELGNALFFIEGHGIKGADALMVLDKAAKLAASGLGETDQLVRIVTGQLVAYGKGAEEAGHFFDVFAKTEQLAALPIGELSGQFQRLTPIAAALNIPIEQVGATIATISQTGLGASRVITDLAGVLNSFIHATPQQQAALKSIGYPLEQLRADLTDPGKGLIPVLQTVWERAGHDINAAGEIFSDRSRALVGFLALIRNSGQDLNKVFSQFADTAGTVDRIFEINQQRISIGWQRLTAVAQAYGIVLTNEIAPQVGQALGAIADAFQSGDVSGGFQAIGNAARTAFDGVITMLDKLAQDAFGGAYNVAVELAKGLWAGANDAINAVVNAIADMIASFLLGNSWPPNGPLSNGTAGVQRWQQAYATALLSGQQIMAGAAGNVATAVNTELAKIGAPGSKVGIQNAIANIDQQLLPWKLAADSIKNSYEAQLHPLERQIAAIQRIKDLEYERQQLGFEQRDLELRMMRIRAEGDPARRAQLAGQLARAQEQREQHSIDSRIATLNREARNLRPGHGTTAQEIALRRREIADELNILHIQQQQHRLVNVQLLGQYETKKQQLDVDKDIASINHAQFELQQKQALQPLLEQRDQLKFKMQAELDVIAAQTDGLEDQRRILESQLKLITARESGQKKAAGGGAGAFRTPEGDPLSLEKRIKEGIDTIAGSMAEGLRTRLEKGLRDFSREYGPAIGEGFIGFMVGGMVAGLPGAIAGAALVPKLAAALAERGVTGADFSHVATSIVAEIRNSFGRVSDRLRAGDILGSVESFMTDARGWIREFQTRFFSEWYSGTTDRGAGGREGPESAGTRHTGIGRWLVESIRGEMIDGPLDFASLQEAFSTLIGRIYSGLTSGTVNLSGPGGSEINYQASPIQQMITAGLKSADFVLGVVGAAADALANSFRDLEGNEKANTAAIKLGNALGVVIMGGTPEGMSSAEGVGKFTEGIRKLDRAMLEAGVSLAKGLVQGFWDEITKGFSAEGVGLHATPGGFLDRVMKGENPWIAMVNASINMATNPDARLSMGGHTALGVPPTGGVGGTFDRTPAGPTPGSGVSGGFGGGAIAQMGEGAAAYLPKWLTTLPEVGVNAVKGLISGLTDAGVMAELSNAAISLATMFLDNVTGSQGFRSRSPSEAMADIGRDAVDGFNVGFVDESSMTGPLVRMWLRSEVIAQAQQILITGEGKSGGLRGVAVDAMDAFADAFGTPPPGLAANMRAIGVVATEAIMDPIEDPRTGVIARMRRIIDAMPKAPRAPATEPTGGSDRNVMAATGADFTVGGSGGTDSEHISLWASPGERVQVGAGANSGGRQINNTFHINVDGGDPDAVAAAVARGVAQAQGDQDAGNELINAWRTAKQQGAYRPNGFPTRRTRG